ALCGRAPAQGHRINALSLSLACSLAGALLVWLVWRALWKGVRWLARGASAAPPGHSSTG
ncbi:DUF4126 domain-containing protein, partial [Stenotrophomonas maltophilia]